MATSRLVQPFCLSRRSVLAALPLAAVLLGSTALPFAAQANRTTAPFSFDLLTEEMRALALTAYAPPAKVESFLDTLAYDDYRLIQFNPERARWQDQDSFFRVHAFHMGWLFEAPVIISEVRDGQSEVMAFTTEDFLYLNELAAKVPAGAQLPGVAGFRLNFPLNRADMFDELVAFQGASYFRALAQGSAYGISARGIAINTGLPVAEEFPRFTAFYLEKPAPGALTAVVYASLEGPSVTGAYRFVITPGVETVMEVTARLFFRADIAQLGVAPLTSMFFYAESNRASFDDYRPQVHDSDGLQITRADGDVLWRALNNPPRLASSYFGETGPRSFGLHQRDRDFAHYQDPSARYQERPSLDVEPIGDWGKGFVRLVEIPTDLESNDNIVAFWVPEGAVAAGDAREYAYRLRWGTLPVDPLSDRGHVFETRSGHGGVAGVEADTGSRKFVIDFKGGMPGRLPDTAVLEPVIQIAGGELRAQNLGKLPGTDIWRLAIDVAAPDGAVVELGAHLAGYGRKLTDVWLYQWVKE